MPFQGSLILKNAPLGVAKSRGDFAIYYFFRQLG